MRFRHGPMPAALRGRHPARFGRPGRLCAAALFSLSLWAPGGAAMAAATANANVALPSAPATAQGGRTMPAAPSLAASAAETASPYRFVVKPRSEPSTTQLLLGGLLAVIFMIRNRFRQR